MNEEVKLREARYFLDRMEAERHDPERFRFNLSAFLSAARSAAQYALNEASGKGAGRRWYDSFLKKAPLIAFFTSERNANIHDRPVDSWWHGPVGPPKDRTRMMAHPALRSVRMPSCISTPPASAGPAGATAS